LDCPATEAERLLLLLDSELDDGVDKEVLRSFLVRLEGAACTANSGDEPNLFHASLLASDILDLLEDDGELEPSLVRQLADAEVARQCRDLEEAIDGRVVVRDESVVEL
jgi:hypothetical protein